MISIAMMCSFVSYKIYIPINAKGAIIVALAANVSIYLSIDLSTRRLVESERTKKRVLINKFITEFSNQNSTKKEISEEGLSL